MKLLALTAFSLCAALSLGPGAGPARALPALGTTAPQAAAASRDGEPMQYSELLRALAAGTIRTAEVDDAASRMEVTLANGDTREVSYPLEADGLIDRLAASGATVRVARPDAGPNPLALVTPALLLLVGTVFVVLFLQQRRGASRKTAAKKAVVSERPAVGFDDVAGCDEA